MQAADAQARAQAHEQEQEQEEEALGSRLRRYSQAEAVDPLGFALATPLHFLPDMRCGICGRPHGPGREHAVSQVPLVWKHEASRAGGRRQRAAKARAAMARAAKAPDSAVSRPNMRCIQRAHGSYQHNTRKGGGRAVLQGLNKVCRWRVVRVQWPARVVHVSWHE